ncbi:MULTISPECIES: helix-turn-helix transcriptional regulator [Streptomyces]|uniref:helix-turn-helix transcriptional regulator n=1 Tax=Streptomyces TaxID=1883 RepID=UPI002248E85C|nr:AAA family ATPase [Streptomyces sp. JHD 1]MCX2971646.1 AAA family ATPase [Streptomyces sp. JHD 1]
MRTRASFLVGRDAELAQLSGALDDARSGRGAGLFLLGEPGIGKSRLAAEAVGRAVDSGMTVLRGRASATGPSVPFRPLSEALMSLVRKGVPFDEGALGPYRSVLGRLVPEWDTGEGVGAAHAHSLVVLAEGVLRLTAAAGRESGCLLFLEDLQDADAETLAVVEYLADNLRSESTLLLCTVRSEPSPALDVVHAVTRRLSGGTVELDRLARRVMRPFLASCLSVRDEEVHDAVVERLWRDSAGVPLVVEELLNSLVSSGRLARGGDGWRLMGDAAAALPVTLTRSVVERADRLGPVGRHLFSVASVLGHRFPLSVVQRVTGTDDHVLLEHLQAGVEAQLVTPDERGPDWYSFQHPLTADALLDRLTPAERAHLSRRAAGAAQELHPGLPRDWCPLAARLWLHAGEPVRAAGLFHEAGRRALADGAAGTAASLLTRAEKLFAAHGETRARAEVLETLLHLLAESGDWAGVHETSEALADELAGMAPERRVALHVRLAWAAYIAGRREDCERQVRLARALLPPGAAVAATAPVDAVAAYLTLDGADSRRVAEAERCARRLVAAADAVTDPVALCQAWHLIGLVTRERDLADAHHCFERALELATRHGIPIWRAYAMIGAAGVSWLSEGNVGVLQSARKAALNVGGSALAENMSATLVMDAILRGDFPRAATLLRTSLATARRMRLGAVERYLHVTRAVLAAHQGRRAEMERALTAFRDCGGDQPHEQTLALGLGRAVCALLEEDGATARAHLTEVVATEERYPTTFYLAGAHGLRVLLHVLDGRMDEAEHAGLAARAPATMRWNRQFVCLAEAVLHGRAGRPERAADAVGRAALAGAEYPTARHLGLRLVAEAAHDGGWGEPVAWLRQAEEHFHARSVPAVASACRALLRGIGAPVRQRRTGRDRVPARLRAAGVTVREFEVLELLPQRLTNKAIAERLHISPRTVEKHIASLFAKSGCADRVALSDYACAALATEPPAAWHHG